MHSYCYYHIHLRERRSIERLYAQGYTAGKIARETFRSRSTIWREIQRNGYPGKDGKWQYKAEIAQMSYNARQYSMYRRKIFTHPVKTEDKAFFPYNHIIRILRTNKSPRGYEPHPWFREYNKSNWNFWGEWSWRTAYNQKRKRIHSWEEMGRRRTRPRKYRSLYKREKSWSSLQSRGKRLRRAFWHTPFHRLYIPPRIEYWRIYGRRSPSKLLPFFPDTLALSSGGKVYRIKQKQKQERTPLFNQPTTAVGCNGKTVSNPLEIEGILKILTGFDPGSPRLLLKSA